MGIQGKVLSESNIRRIVELLTSTDMTIPKIAEKMNCSRSAVVSVKRDYEIKVYAGNRANFTVNDQEKRKEPDAASKEKETKIEVKRYQIETDPSIEIFSVEISDGSGAWVETIPSKEMLQWFLRGVQTGGQMFGKKYVPLPEIPQNSVLLKIEQEKS